MQLLRSCWPSAYYAADCFRAKARGYPAGSVGPLRGLYTTTLVTVLNIVLVIPCVCTIVKEKVGGIN